ncbi:hypothetical protein CR513_15297, partial [Mucuna pruriens]
MTARTKIDVYAGKLSMEFGDNLLRSFVMEEADFTKRTEVLDPSDSRNHESRTSRDRLQTEVQARLPTSPSFEPKELDLLRPLRLAPIKADTSPKVSRKLAVAVGDYRLEASRKIKLPLEARNMYKMEAHVTIERVDMHSVLQFCNSSSSFSLHHLVVHGASMTLGRSSERRSSLLSLLHLHTNPSCLRVYKYVFKFEFGRDCSRKKLLAIVFALDKIHSYLLGYKIIIFFDHASLKFLLKKPDAKPRLIR